MNPDLVIRSRRVFRPGAAGPATIHIRDGKIEAVSEYEAIPGGSRVYDARESVVMPGVVDTHVHINEPGRTEWEGFETATRAAAAGGVTTLVEMPLNSIPATTSVEGFQAKKEAARGKVMVDVGFWGGVVPGNRGQLRPLYEAGVWGFKCFLVPSGVEEFPCVGERDLREAMPVLAELGAVLLVHAEAPGPIEQAMARRAGDNRPDTRRYATWLESRPREAEHEAIALMIRLAREFGARVHIVHLSSSDAVPMLRQARADGVRISVETCPHYLTFCAEEAPDGATERKCAPPIRERENRERLWAALADGTIDLVATDHSPCPPAMKCGVTGDFLQAWGGIASLQIGLAATWTQMRARGIPSTRLAEWMCRAPAWLAGLGHRKGSIAAGLDADFVVWNPDQMFTVERERLYHRHKLTPYAGQQLFGVVSAAFLRGQLVYEKGDFPAGPVGEILLRAKP